jgi:hypothetical protein
VAESFLNFGIWIGDFGFGELGLLIWEFGFFKFGYWILDFGFFHFEFWIWDFEWMLIHNTWLRISKKKHSSLEFGIGESAMKGWVLL